MPIDLDAQRERLLADRGRVVDSIALLHREHAANDGNEAGDHHIADPSVIAVERELDSTLGDSAEAVLAAIDAALARLAGGTYGICTSCGAPVGDARLEARPHSEHCIDCQRRSERR